MEAVASMAEGDFGVAAFMAVDFAAAGCGWAASGLSADGLLAPDRVSPVHFRGPRSEAAAGRMQTAAIGAAVHV